MAVRTETTRHFVHFPTHQPDGWIGASLPTFQSTLQTHDGKRIVPWDTKEIRREQQLRWERNTGVRPQDSSFTLVVPVHNEEKALPSFLAALDLSDVPMAVPMQTLFVVNNSKDRSLEILRKYMGRLGSPRIESFRSSADSEAEPWIMRGCRGVQTFGLVHTKTPGKYNALNIGNHYALSRGDRVCMSLDSDRYPEPDAVAKLFGKAYSSFEAGGDTVLVGGITPEQLPSKHGKSGRITELEGPDRTKKVTLSGPIFAWSPTWVRDIGGIPASVIEDYAIAICARQQGKCVEESNARVWGHAATNRVDKYLQHTRYVQGALQLLDGLEPGDDLAQEAILHDHHRLQPLANRLRTYAAAGSVFSPAGLFRIALRIAYNEESLMHAKINHARNPKAVTWPSIRSTK